MSTKYKNQDVEVRELQQGDAKFGGQFQQGQKKMIVRYPDGHEEVVSEDQLRAGSVDQRTSDQSDKRAESGAEKRPS